MPYRSIKLTKEGKLAIVTLNRPKRLNAFDATLLQELKEVLVDLSTDETIGGILLTGAGRGFCAGADVTAINTDKSFGKLAEQGERSYQAMKTHFNPIIQMIYDMEKPVTAAVNGVAAGFGMSLALVCDIVFAAESASFIQVFVPNLGIIPDGGSTWTLTRLIGQARARAMMLTGKKVMAQQAKEWGMIWECLPNEQLMETAKKTALRLANGPALGIASTKLAMNQSETNSLNDQLLLEAYLQKICCGSEDFAEGATAFLEKRKPNFIGK